MNSNFKNSKEVGSKISSVVCAYEKYKERADFWGDHLLWNGSDRYYFDIRHTGDFYYIEIEGNGSSKRVQIPLEFVFSDKYIHIHNVYWHYSDKYRLYDRGTVPEDDTDAIKAVADYEAFKDRYDQWCKELTNTKKKNAECKALEAARKKKEAQLKRERTQYERLKAKFEK